MKILKTFLWPTKEKITIAIAFLVAAILLSCTVLDGPEPLRCTIGNILLYSLNEPTISLLEFFVGPNNLGLGGFIVAFSVTYYVISCFIVFAFNRIRNKK